MFVEVEAVAVAVADLEEVIVEALLGDLDLAGCVLQRILDLLVLLVYHSRVKLAPLYHLVYYMADPPLLGPAALALLGHFVRGAAVLLLPRAEVFKGHKSVHQRHS